MWKRYKLLRTANENFFLNKILILFKLILNNLPMLIYHSFLGLAIRIEIKQIGFYIYSNYNVFSILNFKSSISQTFSCQYLNASIIYYC